MYTVPSRRVRDVHVCDALQIKRRINAKHNYMRLYLYGCCTDTDTIADSRTYTPKLPFQCGIERGQTTTVIYLYIHTPHLEATTTAIWTWRRERGSAIFEHTRVQRFLARACCVRKISKRNSNN